MGTTSRGGRLLVNKQRSCSRLTYGYGITQRSQSLLEDLLGPEYSSLTDLVKPYLLTSFGSFTRMDYGTGHETSFALFLLCLTLVRYFQPIPEVEREIVLVIFLRYLRLCWRLQDTYRLEPAGSHGVWGLDDSHFLPYIFGSAQLRGKMPCLPTAIDRRVIDRRFILLDQTDIPVNAVLQKPLPETNLYFLSISRIHEVKHGPFHEHSSSLHSIAVGVPNWGKVHSGLFKMYEVSDGGSSFQSRERTVMPIPNSIR
jgi:serine/threonine-protein phosphatase 2A activator